MKNKTAIILDLDNTLLVELAASREAFDAACEGIEILKKIDLNDLYLSLNNQANKLWTEYHLFDFCDDIQVSYCEALCADFKGEDPRFAVLNKWAPTYRTTSWYNALNEYGIDDGDLAKKLGDRFQFERRQRFYTFPDVEETLKQLKKEYRLAMLTNGAPDLQREKVAKSGVESYFEIIVVSGEVGVGKPNPKIFWEVLNQLNISPEQAVMVGDNMSRDILGANEVGITSVWINHEGSTDMENVEPDYEISRLSELLKLVNS